MAESSKHIGDLSSNEKIRWAIRSIALKGVVNSEDGVVRGTSKVTGFVSKIHSDESDDLFGTIDVQEYTESPDPDLRIGLHEGVLLTAIQGDTSGYIIIPKLYSEVLVAKDPSTGNEYVTMFSHVDTIQLDAHENISIGVKEREEFHVDNDDEPDVHELKLTGNEATTSYTKNKAFTKVKDDDDNETTVEITNEHFEAIRDKSKLALEKDDAIVEHGSSKVQIEDGTVYVGSDQNTDDAVLGRELAGILSDLVGYLAQMMTPTSMGPQPPANMIASFITLQAKVKAFSNTHSGFLTKKVQIQK